MTTEMAFVPAQAPNQSEWALMLAQAEQMASSQLVPAQYRKRPADVVTAALMGRELGWGPTTAMRYIHVVEGKPAVSPEGMLALVRRAGHSVTGGTSPTEATATGKRADTGDAMAVTWTMADADRAGLAGKKNWKTYPAAMLWARAVSQLCRQLFPDVLLGAAYVPEEMGADVGADGEPIEASTVPEPAAVDDWPDRAAVWTDLKARIGRLEEEDEDTAEMIRGWAHTNKVTNLTLTAETAGELELMLDEAEDRIIDAEVVDEDGAPVDDMAAPF